MKEVFIKSSELTDAMLADLPKQDLYSIEDILNAYEESLYNLHCLEEEYEDYKEYVGTYKKDRDHWTASEMAEYYANEK